MTTRPPGSNPPERSASDAPDLAGWLTRDLRPKGTPLPSRPPTQPPCAGHAASEPAALADWLRRDLKPKNSRPPGASSPGVSSPGASSPPPHAVAHALLAVSPPAPVSPFALAAESFEESYEQSSYEVAQQIPGPIPAPPFALAPIEEEPPQTAAAPSPPAAAARDPQDQDTDGPQPSTALVSVRDLDEDDLAVLPGRRKTRAPAGRRAPWALLALLVGGAVLGGALLWRRGGSVVSDASGAAVSVPADLGGALLPPPPASAPDLGAPDAPASRYTRGGAAVEGEAEPGLADPRSFLDGPSVRRYADVPSPTLSRLASEQRKRARQRDEAARRAQQQKTKP